MRLIRSGKSSKKFSKTLLKALPEVTKVTTKKLRIVWDAVRPVTEVLVQQKDTLVFANEYFLHHVSFLKQIVETLSMIYSN